MFQCLCTGDGSLLNVKWSDFKEKKTKCILLFCFSRVHQGCHLILKCFEYIKKINWCGFYSLFILLCMAWSVACWNTFPRLFAEIIFFICKNISECQKRKLGFFIIIIISVSTHLSCTPQVQFKLRERDFLRHFWPFLSCDGSAGGLLLSFALIPKRSRHGIVISQSHGGE